MSDILRRLNGLEKVSSAKGGPFTILYVDKEGTHRDDKQNIVEKNDAGMWCLDGKPLSVPSGYVVHVRENMRA
jgi:hypothetical protein